MNKKFAVIMSGHARMVPWGWRMLEDRFTAMEAIADWDVFSYTWSPHSESQPGRPTQEHALAVETSRIMHGLNHRYETDQQPWFEELRQRFLAQGAIPDHDEDAQGFRMPRQSFYRFLGQVLGFCRAVDLWRDQLQGYDYIVRSRWDMTLDKTVLDELIKEEPRLGQRPCFYTKSVDIMQGHLEISGDTIYGHRDQWLEYFPSTDHSVDRILQGTRQRWSQLRSQWNNSMSMDPDLEKYYKTGWWFNSHFIWTTLFLNTSVSLRSLGESFGISPSLAQIPIDKFQYGHCVMGKDWDLRSPDTPQSAIDALQKARANQKDLIRDVQERRRLRAIALEQQIRSQNPR